jgi:multidrug efflux pump subunit AcrB
VNRAIEWFARNGVAANVLMVLIVAGGLITLPTLKQEVFPEFAADRVLVTVEYLGASPEEVEEGICVRVEEAIYGLAGVKRITSEATEGRGRVTAEILPHADARDVLDQVKARVDAIDTFPDESEKPIVEEVVMRRQVIDIAVSGDTDERSLRTVAERVRDEVSALPEISLVQLAGARPYEISIEVSEEALRRHELTFDEVARAVRSSSLDLPGGSVKTAGGEILFRTKGQAYRGADFEDITVMSRADGTRVRLDQVATVSDGFEDTDEASFFDGKPAILIQVFRVGDQGALDIAAAVKSYVEAARDRLPEGITLTTWQDDSAVLSSRLDLLIDDGAMGFVLVCVTLALFLRLKIALWVASGIPVSFLGAVWFLPVLDVSMNMVSLFAFIIVLGIVVDDAIVIGESIYTHLEKGKSAVEAAVAGAREVAVPVVFAVLTTMAAFAPLAAVPGNMGKFLWFVPAVVITTLVFSLLETLFIFPAHLSHLRRPGEGERTSGPLAAVARGWSRFHGVFASGLELFVARVYGPSLELCLRWRYLTLSVGLTVLVLTAAYVASGRTKFVLFPPVDADNVAAMVTMPQGTPAEVTRRSVERLERAALEVLAELESEGQGAGSARVHRHVLSTVGSQPYRAAQDLRRGRAKTFSGGHLGEVNIELASAEERGVTSTEIARRWRERAGPVPDAIELLFTSSLFSSGEAINIQISAPEIEALRLAASAIETRLGEYEGVSDIADSFRAGKQEVKLELKPEAETLGLSLADLARQVRQGFYGEEAQRIQRGRDDVRVMVRYPAAERRSLGDIENVRVRAPGGAAVPFSTVAAATLGRGYASIQRADRERTINVTADVDQTQGNATEIIAELEESLLPELLAAHPGLRYSLEGEQREQAETFGGLLRGFVLTLFAIYALLAIPFRSYVQPFIVMSAIPFGMVGVIWGHWIMGLPLTLLSLFGLVALTGVVVNDSLILVDFVNRERAAGASAREAAPLAGKARFRPILLTSLTTFAGLMPLLLEKSMQAQFLIPMAASLGFGVVFATGVTLVLVPVGYLILDDLRRS